MKQTFLTFGHNTPKKPGRTPECSGNHPSLSSIRNCKKCYTIAALRKRCANTTSLTTGQTVGTWGTKEQVLERLINNARPNQRNKMSEGMSAHSNLLQFCFVCIIIWLFHIFKLTLHLLFSLFCCICLFLFVQIRQGHNRKNMQRHNMAVRRALGGLHWTNKVTLSSP